MRIVVQKFGGTSVSTLEAREKAIEHIRHAKDAGLDPVVVVSAMGRAGDPYATDTLIKNARDILPEMPPRELDMLISCGEIIAAVIMTGSLKKAGLPAVALSGRQAGIITDVNYANAAILKVEPETILKYLRGGCIPVVAGFQGCSEEGEMTTLGRGGSDTTAAALGAALRAEVVDIFTDVDGIKTADPRIVPEAKTIGQMTYDEVFQIANEGAKVIHPRAAEICMRTGVPLRVRSTFDESPGTLITYSFDPEDKWPIRVQHAVTAVTHLSSMVLVKVKPGRGERSLENEVEIFRALADANISVDMISVSPEQSAFIISEDDSAKAKQILESMGYNIETTTGCARVSIVGTKMRGVPGVMAKVVEALYRANVQILHTVDSHVTISCLVRQDQMEASVRALHEEFDLAKTGR